MYDSRIMEAKDKVNVVTLKTPKANVVYKKAVINLLSNAVIASSIEVMLFVNSNFITIKSHE